MKIFLKNNFMCLVTFWKCYFPPPPPQNPPPLNRKTTKTPPPTPPSQQQQNQRSKRESKKSKSQTNFITKISNENKNESVTSSRVRGATRQCDRSGATRGSWCYDLGFVGSQCDSPVRSARCEWVRRQSSVSGFENDGEMISPVVQRSLYSLCLSLRAWSRNGETILMIGDWVQRGWVWTIGVVRSSCSDAIFLLWRRQSSCSFSLSLSLFYFPRLEIIWSEKKTEIIFRCFGSNFRSTGNAFQFDQIWSNNQIPNFPENHFQNQFEVKTNRA